MLYLDYQSTTPLPPEALEAMLPWLGGPGSDGYANPASQYRAGRAAAAAVELARDRVAALLPKDGQVFSTSGATEALNWALIRGARSEADPAKRLAMLSEAEGILLRDGPVIPIYHYSASQLVKPYVRGIHNTLLDVHPLTRVWIDHGNEDAVAAGGAR